MSQPTKVQKALNLHAVPQEKWPVMVQKTILGILFVSVGVWGLLHEWNHYLGIAVILLGATVWSGQVVTNALLSLVQPFKAIKRALSKDDADAAP